MRNIYFLHLVSMFFYLIGFFYSLSSVTWIGCWLGMEISNLMIYIWFHINMVSRNIMISSLYYWVSGLSGFGLLGCYFLYGMYPFFSLLGAMFFFVFKLGLFPFYGWSLLVFKRTEYMVFFFLSVVVKLPLFMLMDYFLFNFNIFLFFLGFIFSYISMYVGMTGMSQFSLSGFLGYSSINVAGDLFISYLLSYDMFLMVYLGYSFLLLFLLVMVYSLGINLKGESGFSFCNLTNNQFSVFSQDMIFLVFFGMPFFLSFYVKFYFTMFFLVNNFSFLSIFFVFFLIMLSCLNYYRCWSLTSGIKDLGLKIYFGYYTLNENFMISSMILSLFFFIFIFLGIFILLSFLFIF